MSVPAAPVVTTGRVVRVGIGTTTVVAGPQVAGVPRVVGVRAAAAVVVVSVGVMSVPAAPVVTTGRAAARAAATTVAVGRPAVAVL
ncbi:hypothetical protein [Streptomyces sp. S4.7]|uniref:hypothetical protein n=1 Tax=Streptomyces sp. S4.7 TaxID=2705439 RepID=UPI00193F6B73|nr:hypothetical protein [Streptomyces sp. S4.7]